MAMTDKLPDISGQALWSVSSCKQGFGVACLYDRNVETFWQSDGEHPHHVSIQFHSRQRLHTVSVYLDIDKDESYTPCKIVLRAGTNQDDVQLIKDIDLATEPRGWHDINVSDVGGSGSLQAHYLRLEFPLNYENGRDVRVRQVRVFGPPVAEERFKHEQILPFNTPEFYMYG
ncbi:Anaphase-promoting complex subunit 10 [Dipsacomyces acuminosporus]|nr:Anaphase-promoting complex subunit 10 [Dipsacomyces acuminosporus]